MKQKINRQVNKVNFASLRSVVMASSPYGNKNVVDKEFLQAAKTVSQAVLLVIGAAGTITLAAVAPNIFKALREVNKISAKFLDKGGKQKNGSVLQTIYYLRRSGQIEFKKDKGGIFITLTQRGKEILRRFRKKQPPLPKQEKWNGKWWLVAADIPTKPHKTDADLFRKKLKELGFFSLQRTLWLYPYDPCGTINFLVKRYFITPYVTVMEVSRLEKEDEARVKGFFTDKLK